MPDRVQQNQPGTIYATWEQDGAQIDPGTVTVTIISDATGNPVVTGAPTLGGPGPQRTYKLTPAQTASLDLLRCTWTAADGSSVFTEVEIAGGFLFSVAYARKRSPLQDVNTYPTQSILYYRTLAEMALEDICGVAFVPRYSRDNAFIGSYGLLDVARRRVRAVRQITTQTNNGPQALPTLLGVRIEPGGGIFMPTLWNWWSMPITVGYEHGYDVCPPRVSRACLELARRWIVESPWDERMSVYKSREGGQIDIQTATGMAFDIPEVNAIAEMYGTPMAV